MSLTSHPRYKARSWPAASAFAQRGQAIIYIVAMLPAIFLSILVIYNTATLTREKMSLQNTADATTYSVGVVVARNLNYLSYTNRAMAANESGIATIASMQTTVASLITTLANLFEAQALVYAAEATSEFAQIDEPIVGQLVHLPKYFIALGKAQKANNNARKIGNMQEGVAFPFRGFADILRVLNYGISGAQDAMYLSTIAAIPTTLMDVMEKNDPNAKLPAVDTALNMTQFAIQYGTYIRPYSQKLGPGSRKKKFDEALRFAHSAQAMRDDWTKNRRLLPGLFGKANFMGTIMKFLFTKVIEFKGGSELVAETNEGINIPAEGRIRWQSADAVYVNAPIDWLLGSLPIPTRDIDIKDTAKLRFGLGAGTAAQGGPNISRSWYGHQITLPPAGLVARTYGGLNDTFNGQGVMDRSAFERSAASDDRELIWETPTAIVALILDVKWRYGPRQEIGLVTSDWYMPPYWDVTTHPQMREYESDNFMGQQVINGKNPLKWGSKSDRGPVFTLTMEKDADKINTGEQAKIGYATGKIGLKDNMVKNKIKVLSSTQIYFRRPQDRWGRRDLGKDSPPKVGFTGGYIEHRSLFSPYWHVHNVQPSLWARAVALGTNLVGNASEPDWSNNQSEE